MQITHHLVPNPTSATKPIQNPKVLSAKEKLPAENNDVWNENIKTVKKIVPLTPKQAITLLCVITGEQESPAMHQLALVLEFFHFAIYQAALYIRANKGLNVAEYSRLYDLSKNPLTAPLQTVDCYRQVLSNIWKVTQKKLMEETPKAVEWLNLCAYLDSDRIPTNLLSQWLKATYPENSSTLYDSILHSLSKYGLIKYQETQSFFSTHPLLQEVFKSDGRSEAQKQMVFKNAFDLATKQWLLIENPKKVFLEKNQKSWEDIDLFFICTHLLTNKYHLLLNDKTQCSKLETSILDFSRFLEEQIESAKTTAKRKNVLYYGSALALGYFLNMVRERLTRG